MGKIVGGPFGQLSGKTGDLVGGSWKGIATIKRYQPKVANPQTAGQVAQRGKMANVVAFAQAILATVIKPCWDRFQSGQSGFNAFVSRNIALFTGALPSIYANLITSTGKMAATSIATIVATDLSADVTITWLDDTGQGFKLTSDRAYIVIAHQGVDRVFGFATAAIRDDLSVTVQLDDAPAAGTTLHVYLTFLRADGTVVSQNSYLSKLIA
jgi:hypothetical protein